MSEQPEQPQDSPEQPEQSDGDSHSDPRQQEAAATYNREMIAENQRHANAIHEENGVHTENVNAISNRYTSALSATEQA